MHNASHLSPVSKGDSCAVPLTVASVTHHKQYISHNAEIDERLRESELGFRDAEHKNAKHQHHHLLNAFDLQRKLREELLGRIYAMQDCKRYK